MANRMPINLFVSELAAALNRGDGYIMASYGQNPRTGYLDLSVPESQCKSGWKPNGWYYAQYSGSQRTQALKWREKCARVWDCNGLAEGIYEIFSGVCINARARNNYAGWCSVKGTGMIPAKYRVPGAAVFWSSSGASSIHHVAYLWKPVTEGKPDGDWYLIEARGVMYGVVKSKLNSRKPNFWGLMDKYFDYSGAAAVPSPSGASSAGETVQGTASSETGPAGPGDGGPRSGSEEVVSSPVNTVTPSASAAEEVVHSRLLGSRILRNGAEGEDVKAMQSGLIRLGYDLGKWGADGDFGDQTEMAVKAFQQDHPPLEVDGEFGPKSLAAFEQALAALDRGENTPEDEPRTVTIADGNCYVRTAPNTAGKILGVAYRGDQLPWQGEVSEDGWLLAEYKGVNGWVSGKYGRLE